MSIFQDFNDWSGFTNMEDEIGGSNKDGLKDVLGISPDRMNNSFISVLQDLPKISERAKKEDEIVGANTSPNNTASGKVTPKDDGFTINGDPAKNGDSANNANPANPANASGSTKFPFSPTTLFPPALSEGGNSGSSTVWIIIIVVLLVICISGYLIWRFAKKSPIIKNISEKVKRSLGGTGDKYHKKSEFESVGSVESVTSFAM